jgi:hypothetical protein
MQDLLVAFGQRSARQRIDYRFKLGLLLGRQVARLPLPAV